MENMLEHQILVLQNVIGNKPLFRKEIEKSAKWLNVDELEKLKNWLSTKVDYEYIELLDEVLEQKLAS